MRSVVLAVTRPHVHALCVVSHTIWYPYNAPKQLCTLWRDKQVTWSSARQTVGGYEMC